MDKPYISLRNNFTKCVYMCLCCVRKSVIAVNIPPKPCVQCVYMSYEFYLMLMICLDKPTKSLRNKIHKCVYVLCMCPTGA